MTFRFLFGLAAFILVAWLIDEYDKAHGTGYVWYYGGLVILGFMLANRQRLAAGAAATSASVNSVPPKAGKP